MEFLVSLKLEIFLVPSGFQGVGIPAHAHRLMALFTSHEKGGQCPPSKPN
jgi:hypothetical protein